MVIPLRWTIGTLAAMALALNAQAWAQQAPVQQNPQQRQGQLQRGQQTQQVQPGQRQTTLRPVEGRASMADHQIAYWLILCNEKEVRIAQLGAKQAESQAVREFAEKMVQGHNNLINQLRQFAPDTPTLAAATSQERTGREERQQGREERQQQPLQQREDQAQGEQPGRTTQPPGQQAQQQGQFQQGQGQQAGQGLPMLNISYELAQRSLATCERELKAKQGKEFDKAFMMGQVFGHEDNWIVAETLKKYASPQLQEVLNQAVPHIEQHLSQAREICEQLKEGRETKTSSQEDRSNG